MLVVPVTGRPAGWCDHIARMWPVDAVVGENGAFYFRYDRRERRLVKRFRYSDTERAEFRARLDAVRETILRAVPGCAVASDQPYRNPTWPSIFARTCRTSRRGGGADRRNVRGGGRDRQGQFHSRQRLVRPLRQAGDGPHPDGRGVRNRSGRGARCVRLCRRFTERYPDVRILSAVGRSGERARFSAMRTCLHRRRPGWGGIRGSFPESFFHATEAPEFIPDFVSD